jgi:hypothetical protein
MVDVKRYIEEVKRKLENMTFAEIKQKLSDVGITVKEE